MRSAFSRCLAAGALTLVSWPVTADEMQSTSLDLIASGGYSTRPTVTSNHSGSSGGSAFVRLSADAAHAWTSERTSTDLTGFWEGSEYFGEGMRNLVSLRAATTHAVNKRLAISALADARADFNGELSNRFLNVSQPGQPETGPPPGPPSDLFLYSGRQYRADGTVALAWDASERSKVSASVGASRETFSGSNAKNHTLEFGTVSYDHLLSERTTLGAQLTASRTDFDQPNLRTLIINPAATFSSHLSNVWTLSGSLGASFSQVTRPVGDLNTIDPSFTASVCHETDSRRLCARASHYAESLGIAALVQTTTVSLDWIADLDAYQTLLVSAGYQHYGKAQVNFAVPQGDQYRAAASYNRHINDRLSVGANVTASRLAQLQGKHPINVSGWIFISYRLGDRR